MTSPAELCAFLTSTAVIMVCLCNAERLPPPTGLSYRWIDAFTVNVSWQEPRGLPAGDIRYEYSLEDPKSHVELTTLTHFSANLLTEETGSGSWTYLVWTVSKNGDNLEDSTKVPKTIETPKPRAQVEDIQCFVNLNNETKAKEMNCSWVPGNQALYLSFRICGHTHKTILGLKNCVWPYSNAMRKGCYLKADGVANNICMLLESEAGQSTFKLLPMIDPPELSIGEEGDNLKLSWTLPPILKDHPWIFMVCSRKCSHAEVCQNYTTKGEPWFMPYDKSCRYELRSRVRTGPSVPPIFSQFGQVVFYGNNLPADKTLTVVAVVLPIILSVCIFLSCYCFRRHSSILCPVIPDPSAIFKEMMMDGNKDLKSTMGSLYTPVPEPVESCKVDTVTDSIVVPLNS
ncbi:interleukin-13 receptor subunit alpha-1-like isoform X2 [Cyclopterus lumpus]|uniref:Uncharacterized protein n=1 Tax=Cyclopterus lumpus TaxID=8103 RepID=A0A8C2YYR8_CYCLU|nr:interleukin-13 receptor subunit alpha-1-like isoform X2 [Cyclopterus lumpus]